MPAKIITFFIQKGGTGKTTCAANTSAGLARLGHRVLAIDLDPQNNLALSLGVQNPPITSYELLTQSPNSWHSNLPAVDISGPYTNSGGCLHVLPGSIDLAAIDREIAHEPDHVFRLRNALQPVRKNYDYILLDNPPTVNAAVINGLAAANALIAPVRADFLSVAGVTQLLRTIELARKGGINTNLHLNGIILTFYDPRTNLSKMAASQLRQHFGNAVLSSTIRDTVTIGEAPATGNDIFRYAPSSPVAEDFRKLCLEIQEKF
ncbi:MAG: ParA family protein [Chthoniobacterales bacterium]|nr:ParA family protein [Chthoniobacterales bacterium]